MSLHFLRIFCVFLLMFSSALAAPEPSETQELVTQAPENAPEQCLAPNPCGWFGRIQLTLSQDQVEFWLLGEQEFDGYVVLPGSVKNWPLNVRV